MSCMLCSLYGALVDTDDDPDSLYVDDYECACKGCRDEQNLETEFDK